MLAPDVARAAAAPTLVTQTSMHGRQAFTIANGHLSLSVAPGGGFIGDIRLVSKNPKLDISPMRVPNYQTIDPYTFDLRRDGPIYGTGNQRQLMSGYMGHFTCFPQFGHSDAEFAATGYGQHGEAILAKWETLPSAPEDLVMEALLPQNRYRFRRYIKLLPGETVAYITEEAENLQAYERPLQWVQHVTMGPPWAEIGKLWADGSVDRAIDQMVVQTGAEPKLTTWPKGTDAKGETVDFRAFVGNAHTWLMQRDRPRNWVTGYHQDYNVLFGHIYDAKLNPWLVDWQNNRHVNDFPEPGVVTARGFCWGDSPLPDGIKAAVQHGPLFGVPTYSWIGSRAKRTQSYVIFMTEVPSGWLGTAELSTENGTVSIAERGTGRVVTIGASNI